MPAKPVLLLKSNLEIVNGPNLRKLVAEKKKSAVTSKIPFVEKVLLAKLKSGDNSAFSTIFSAYYRDLVLFAARFTKDQENAEEVVQDIFVKLWEDHESIKIDISLKSFLLRSVQNKCIDMIRHRKIKDAHSSYVLENHSLFECDTDNYVLFSELREQIDRTLNRLPDELSGTFRMSRFKGLKYDEIAEILNVSVRTIEVRISKALNVLRTELKDYIWNT